VSAKALNGQPASVESVKKAMRRGTNDSIPKPFALENVEFVTDPVARLRTKEQRIATLTQIHGFWS
jgi:DNA-binding NtrC family response regulator